jgi:hypothetical protein
MKHGRMLLFPIALALAAQVQAPETGTLPAADSGASTCATAWQPQHSMESYAWVMGFWSGVNSERDRRTAPALAASRIVEQVKKTCVAEPSTPLAIATSQTYQRLAAVGL